MSAVGSIFSNLGSGLPGCHCPVTSASLTFYLRGASKPTHLEDFRGAVAGLWLGGNRRIHFLRSQEILRLFVVFEGVDGAGKSTQLDLCFEWLVSTERDVVLLRDPGSTDLGKQVRNILLHRGDTAIDFVSETFLFMAARAQLVREKILPALARQQTVLCDRFLLSTMVYQGYAGSTANALSPQSIAQMGYTATTGLQPDITLVFDLPVDVAWQRVGSERDSLESRGKEYFEKVRHGFLTEAAKDDSIRVIDAQPSAKDIHEVVKQEINSYLAS